MKKNIFFFIIFTFSIVQASWPTSVDSALFVDTGLFPYLTVDPNDQSVIAVYLNGSQMRAKKYDRYGYPLWNGSTVVLRDTIRGQMIIDVANLNAGQWGQVISDDSGGVIVCWEDYRHAALDPFSGYPLGSTLYLQRVNAAGTIRYGLNGKRISSIGTEKWHPLGDVKPVNNDGYVVSYYGDTTAFMGALKKYRNDGELSWERYITEGFNLDVNTTDNYGNIFISSGGAYGQPNRRMKVDSNGNFLWPESLDGRIPDDRKIRHGGAFSDLHGGVIGVGPGGFLRINRVDSNGNFMFGENGIDLGGGQFAQINYAPDMTGGLYVSWDKNGVRLQRITFNGIVTFDSSGLLISTEDLAGGRITQDDSNGVICIWPDVENLGIRPFYAQRIDSLGNLLWGNNGVKFYDMSGEMFTITPKMLHPDGHGGAIYLWTELGQGNRIMMKQISRDGILGDVPSGIVHSASSISNRSFRLLNNYPNPFNNSTNISFNLPAAGQISLCIYTVNGQKVMELINEYLPSGSHRITWNGQNKESDYVSSGVYFYTIIYNNTHRINKKMLLIK